MQSYICNWLVFVGAVLSTCGSLVGAQPREVFTDDFKSKLHAGWQVADYDFSHPMFDTDWRRKQIAFVDGIRLSLSPKSDGKNQFDGASIRREQKTHYGRYQVQIRPARGAGVVTGFFTYSGPYYGTRHDEIDIEFLGKDTTQIHIAWFVDGELNNKFIDLGFDAADQLRTYAFDWQPDRVRWYVEDKLIYEHTALDGPVPQVPGYLFANLWAADQTISSWSGIADPERSYKAHLGQISYTAAGKLQNKLLNRPQGKELGWAEQGRLHPWDLSTTGLTNNVKANLP